MGAARGRLRRVHEAVSKIAHEFHIKPLGRRVAGCRTSLPALTPRSTPPVRPFPGSGATVETRPASKGAIDERRHPCTPPAPAAPRRHCLSQPTPSEATGSHRRSATPTGLALERGGREDHRPPAMNAPAGHGGPAPVHARRRGEGRAAQSESPNESATVHIRDEFAAASATIRGPWATVSTKHRRGEPPERGERRDLAVGTAGTSRHRATGSGRTA